MSIIMGLLRTQQLWDWEAFLHVLPHSHYRKPALWCVTALCLTCTREGPGAGLGAQQGEITKQGPDWEKDEEGLGFFAFH